MEGLEAENIDCFISRAKVKDYLNYGKAYMKAVQDKINMVQLDLDSVNRFEVIDEADRAYCKSGEHLSIKGSIQDNGKTLKLFIKLGSPRALFTTEDGVAIVDEMDSVIAIDEDYNVDYTRYKWANKSYKIFGTKIGADKYIMMNKPLLSLNEIDENIDIYTADFEKLLLIAKERVSENE